MYNLDMAYQVLYRTYRPSKFNEVVGQDYIVKTLCNAIKNQKIAHAYLFAGPRGTGKTTVAKLFAKAINCESFKDESCDECDSCKTYLRQNHPDIIEMDAASNNGIDEIREIIDQVPYAPILGKYKVYIIDEVHMLSTSAFNALLKTLEEPPAHVVFILATTDPQKVIPTVLSRCQRYNFAKINPHNIKERLIKILNEEKLEFDNDAVEEISRMAEGGMRDALSLLEQCLAYNPDGLKINDVQKIFGLTSTKEEVKLYTQIHKNQISEVIQNLRQMYSEGIDTKHLAMDLLEIVKDTLIYSDQGKESLLQKLSPIEAQNILSKISIDTLLDDAKNIEDVLSKEKQSQNFLAYLELCLIQMSNTKDTQIQITETKQKFKKEISKKIEIEKPKQEEKPIIENIQTYGDQINIDKEFLLKILLDANKDLKINDQIIYNKLDLYKYEPEKRKFYQLLIGTELFACNKDAIIVVGSKAQIDNINIRMVNEELYNFINKEFGIDKMIYAISEEDKKELIEKYKNEPVEKRNKPVYVEKYTLEKDVEDCPEDTLSLLFGDKVKIED